MNGKSGVRRGFYLFLVTVFLSSALFMGWPAQRASAMEFILDPTPADEVDANPGDGYCMSSNGRCTLRAAIMEANALPGPDSISIPYAGFLLNLTIPGPGEDSAQTGDLDITDSLTITGNDPVNTIINGGAIDRVFHVDPGVSGITVTLENMTITNGDQPAGAGIRNMGALTLVNVSVRNNVGLGIYNDGGWLYLDSSDVSLNFDTGIESFHPSMKVDVTLIDSDIVDNDGWGISGTNTSVTMIGGSVTGSSGAGIGGNGIDVTLDGVDISSNTGAVDGGGLYLVNVNVPSSLTNCTITGNVASGKGGGVYVWAFPSGPVTITGGEISENTAVNGAGLYVESGTATLDNVTVVDNLAAENGGGAYVDTGDTLDVVNGTVIGQIGHANVAGTMGPAGSGGGIYNIGTLLMDDTHVDYNEEVGIYNAGTAAIAFSSISWNQSTDWEGGGIYNEGTLTLDSSSIAGNTTPVYGGGIFNYGDLTIVDSTFSSNTATLGGAIMNWAGATDLIIQNSTFSSNSADQGGAIYNYALLSAITNSTFSGNSASSSEDGGGIYNLDFITDITNTIIANSPSGDNCYGSSLGGSHNLTDLSGCSFIGFTDSSSLNLGVLQDNGGPTHTHALLQGSAAINAAESVACPSTDQRGVSRPNGVGCDVGAYEYQIPAPVDFDFDYRSDVVVFRQGAWRFFDYASAGFDHGVWIGASPGCIPAPLDYDGDGEVEPSQLCSGAWHFYHDDGTYNKGIWTGGVAGDLPVPADYDGDGTDDVVVWRAGAWRFFDFTTASFDHGVWTGSPPHWLGGTNIPVPMDYDGDGAAEFTVFSGGPWHFYNDDGTYNKGIWTGGVAGDLPVPADYDGDLTEDVVVWRSGAWRFFDFATGAFDHGVWTGAPPHWLGGTPLPSPLDYDGDGVVDFTVFSGGPWHFYDGGGVYTKGIWTGGVAGDLPISRRLLP